MAQVLERTTFSTSRLLEFFTRKELSMQIGDQVSWWPIALVKELIDNALDACETAGVLPEINVEVGPDRVRVQDNGPGLPIETLRKSLDYSTRTSDKLHYVSPTRGQLGNALKCVYAASYVANGSGQLDIVTPSYAYHVDVSLDRIAQEPKLELSEVADSVKTGTRVTIQWPEIARLLEGSEVRDFYNPERPSTYSLLANYAMFNPHATFTLNDNRTWSRTSETCKKWLPSAPTSAHWYSSESLVNLVAAYITDERRNGRQAKTVREFVSEFRGLRGSAKQKTVLEIAGLSGLRLADMVHSDEVDAAVVERLLAAMQGSTKPVQPHALGVIGNEHLTARMVKDHCVDLDSIRYKKVAQSDGLPYVLEMAFGVYTEESQSCGREIITGLNWAPTLRIPVPEFARLLGEMRVDRHDPVVVVMHIARPEFTFTTHGKGGISI